MNTVFSCCYTALAAIILGLLLKKLIPEISSSVVILAMVACFTSGIAFVGVIKDEILTLASDSGLPEGSVETVLQVSSVGLISKICSEFCKQTGETALASAVEFLGSAAALFCSLPLWRGIGGLLLSFLST